MASQELVDRFLDNACPDHHVRGGSDHVRAQDTAMRLLRLFPEIAKASFYTAVVCGDLEAVTSALAADRGLATRATIASVPERAEAGGEADLAKRDWGPKGWEPLSYLGFTRLPLESVARNAATIAGALLDHGASPNVSFRAGSCDYTPLVGAIGEGEEGRPAHSERDALVQLLLDRGADPYDTQVVYNIHFNGKVLWYLRTIYDLAQRTGRGADWLDPEWTMLAAGTYGTGARWFLDTAVDHNDLELAEWCLDHHANPNSMPGPGRRGHQHTLYEEAMFRGHVELAELLVRYGARRSSGSLPPLQSLMASCRRADLAAIRTAIAQYPELVLRSEPLFEAATYDQRDAAALLLDLGTSPDIESPEGERALHMAAYHDSVHVAELLIARGALVDPIGRQYGNTPLGGALHCQSRRVSELLSHVSRSAWEIAYVGNVRRLRELLAEKPERARGYDGETLLMWLPTGDEAVAMEEATLLMDHGADPSVRDPQGGTAADRAERNAMFDLAALLRNRSRP